VSGKEIGKENRLYHEAKKMYVEGALKISQIQIRLQENHGYDRGYVSDTTLSKWRSKGNWDDLREKFVAGVLGIPETTRRIAAKVVTALEKKDPGDWTSADSDTLAKMNKIMESLSDPQDELRVGVKHLRRFGMAVKDKDATLAAALAPHIIDYIEQLGEQTNGE